MGASCSDVVRPLCHGRGLRHAAHRLHSASIGYGGATFDERHAIEPLTYALGDPAVDLPKGVVHVLATMVDGEKALARVRPSMAWGREGNAPLGVGPNATVDYELHLIKVREVNDVCGGAVTKKVLRRSLWTGSPRAGDEVTVEWSGEVLESGVTFAPTRAFEFVAGEELPRGAGGMAHFPGRVFEELVVGRMGEGEEVELIVQPSWGYGEAGDAESGVPAGAALKVRLTLKGWVGVEDLSPTKDRTCIKRTLKRGGGSDEPPRYRYECTIDLKVRVHLPHLARTLLGMAPCRLASFGTRSTASFGRRTTFLIWQVIDAEGGGDGEVIDTWTSHLVRLGTMPDAWREAMRTRSNGACVDKVCASLIHPRDLTPHSLALPQLVLARRRPSSYF